MLSKTALSVVKAMVALADLAPDEFEGAAAVAKRIDAPQNYLSKQLKALASTGLVESQKGKGGGFRLGRSPERISLYDVIEPIDQVSKWTGCFLGGRCDCRVACPVHDRWAIVREEYLNFLKETSVSDVKG